MTPAHKIVTIVGGPHDGRKVITHEGDRIVLPWPEDIQTQMNPTGRPEEMNTIGVEMLVRKDRWGDWVAVWNEGVPR